MIILPRQTFDESCPIKITVQFATTSNFLSVGTKLHGYHALHQMLKDVPPVVF